MLGYIFCVRVWWKIYIVLASFNVFFLLDLCLSVCFYLFPALSWWCSSRMTPIRTQGKRLIAGSTPSSFCLSPTGPSEFYLSLVKCLEKFSVVCPRGALMILHRKHGEHVRCGMYYIRQCRMFEKGLSHPDRGRDFSNLSQECIDMFGQQSSLSSKLFITLQARKSVGSRNCVS